MKKATTTTLLLTTTKTIQHIQSRIDIDGF